MDEGPTGGWPGPAPEAAPPAAGAPRLSLAGICHAYARERVLDAVDLDVRAGEIMCLLGPSGCGKTTLLRVAAGVERQTAGEVRVDGRLVAGGETFVPAEKRALGLVFQDYALFPHLTVLANVTYGLRDRPRREAEAAARAALSGVGLSAYERAYPHALSGGEQQRTALVRALLPAPRVLLLDEPFSGLDRTLRARVRRDTVALLKERRATALMVTHDPDEALAIADRIAVMESGRIVQLATPEGLYDAPASLYAAGLLSELNTFPATVEAAAAVTPFGRVPAPGIAEGGRVTVAIRPEHLYIGDGSGVAARVVSARFFGSVMRYECRVPGLPEPLAVVERGARRASAGETVPLAGRLDRFLAFPG